jgi:hypothetical protein
LGQSYPVRQLKKAGIVNKSILQHLQIHISLEQLVCPGVIVYLGTNKRAAKIVPKNEKRTLKPLMV